MGKKLQKYLDEAEKTEQQIAELEERLRTIRAAQKKGRGQRDHSCHPQHQDGRARTAGSAGRHSGGQRDVPDRCKQRFGGSRNGGSD